MDKVTRDSHGSYQLRPLRRRFGPKSSALVPRGCDPVMTDKDTICRYGILLAIVIARTVGGYKQGLFVQRVRAVVGAQTGKTVDVNRLDVSWSPACGLVLDITVTGQESAYHCGSIR